MIQEPSDAQLGRMSDRLNQSSLATQGVVSPVRAIRQTATADRSPERMPLTIDEGQPQGELAVASKIAHRETASRSVTRFQQKRTDDSGLDDMHANTIDTIFAQWF